MAKTIAKAPPEVAEACQRMMEKWHPDLVAAGATVSLLWASNDKGPSVKLHGRPCCAVVWVNSLRDRIEGKRDATIEVSAEWWQAATPEERDSVMDHELYHLVPERGPDIPDHEEVEGSPGELRKVWRPSYKLDEVGRPALRLKLHDWDLGGFAEIVRRHGPAAIERQAFLGVAKAYEQVLLEWG
jgi:hypothetical protein